MCHETGMLMLVSKDFRSLEILGGVEYQWTAKHRPSKKDFADCTLIGEL